MDYRGLGVEYGNMGQYETAFDRAARRRRGSFKPSSELGARGSTGRFPSVAGVAYRGSIYNSDGIRCVPVFKSSVRG
jgi:hypothetical protein